MLDTLTTPGGRGAALVAQVIHLAEGGNVPGGARPHAAGARRRPARGCGDADLLALARSGRGEEAAAMLAALSTAGQDRAATELSLIAMQAGDAARGAGLDRQHRRRPDRWLAVAGVVAEQARQGDGAGALAMAQSALPADQLGRIIPIATGQLRANRRFRGRRGACHRKRRFRPCGADPGGAGDRACTDRPARRPRPVRRPARGARRACARRRCAASSAPRPMPRSRPRRWTWPGRPRIWLTAPSPWPTLPPSCRNRL